MIKNGKPKLPDGAKEHSHHISREQFDHVALLIKSLMVSAEKFGKQNAEATLEEAIEAALKTINVKGTDEESMKEVIRTLVDITVQAARVTTVIDGVAPTGRLATEMMTTGQVADYLQVSRQHVVELTNRGLLSFRMVGRYRRLLRSEVEEFHLNGLQRASSAAAALARKGKENEVKGKGKDSEAK